MLLPTFTDPVETRVSLFGKYLQAEFIQLALGIDPIEKTINGLTKSAWG